MLKQNNHQLLLKAKERFYRDPTVATKISKIMSTLNSSEFLSSPIISIDQAAIILDLSKNGKIDGSSINDLSVKEFCELIENAMYKKNTRFAYGKWGESRDIYTNDLFNSSEKQSKEKRNIHMGVDVFCKEGTDVSSPLAGKISFIANNKKELDYGPMLILEHSNQSDESFYTLYGHLELNSIKSLEQGQSIRAGEVIARVGSPPENGNWPPHLHFQLIIDLLNLGTDFPGVALLSEKDIWLTLSPCPGMFFPNVRRQIDGSSFD